MGYKWTTILLYIWKWYWCRWLYCFTTTTFSLGVALAKEGKKVLLIDADPQGDLTTCMGYYNQDELQNTIGGVRIDIWTHFMRGCIIDYVH